MNISIEIYRARIGIRNAVKTKNKGTKNDSCLVSILKEILLNKLVLLLVLYYLISLFAIAIFVISSYLLVNTALISYYVIFQESYLSIKKHIQITISLPFLLIKHGNKITKCLRFFIISQCFSLINRMLLLMAGNNLKNPGPKSKKTSLSFAVWNMDSILARNGVKIPLVEGLDATTNLDLFGVCESYLSEDINNEQIKIHGFSPDPLRADCKENGRSKGGVVLYYKPNVPIKERADLTLNFDETVVAEIQLKNKKVFFVVTYRSPSQTSEQCGKYFANLETLYSKLIKEKPHTIVLTGDYNARSPLLWDEEQTESAAGKKLSDFMMLNNLDQLIDEPTHFPRENIATCIDLIFTNQPSSFVDVGVFSSLDTCCKHDIIHGKLNFGVPPPPPYKRHIWKYKKANTQAIKDSINLINWFKIFDNKKAEEATEVFTKIIMDIMTKYIPNENVTVNDADAPWITPKIKTAIKRNHRVYRKWKSNGRNPEGKGYVKEVQIITNNLIQKAKMKYNENLGEDLSDPLTGPKRFSKSFKRLTNKKKCVNIPPLVENGKFVTNFQSKANIFNDYFAIQARPMENDSVLPELVLRTNDILENIEISKSTIVKIIDKLNPNKAHGLDNISIAMLKLCSEEISLPLKIIFERCLHEGTFPSSWKKANVQPIHKKGSRQYKTQYRPISLLPICSKIFEKILFDKIYAFLNDKNLISPNQSGFRPGDSTINQLLAITTEIYEAFESYDETRAVFLDISKAFDKVWHEGLIFKLKSNGIRGKLLNLITNFLTNRQQRVLLNGCASEWKYLLSGVPQGSVLGPLLFLVYINDLTDNISSNMRLFADDSSLFARVQGVEATHQILLQDLQLITQWAYQWKMQFNPDITKQAIEVIFSHKINKPIHPILTFNGIPVARKDSTKHIGLILDEKLSFRKHIKEALIKAKNGLGMLKFISRYVSRDVLDKLYKMYIRPHLDYGDVIYHGQVQENSDLAESIQYQAALIVTNCWQSTSREKIYKELGWESLYDRRHYRRLVMYYKIKSNFTPDYLKTYIDKFPITRTMRFSQSFFPYCSIHWNNLPDSIKYLPTLSKYKKALIKTIRPEKKDTFGIRDKYGLSLLTRLRVDFNDLREYRFRRLFNCDTPICACTLENESNEHFFLRCPRFESQRLTLLNSVCEITESADTIFAPSSVLCDLLLYGSVKFSDDSNHKILASSIRFIKATKRFKVIEAYDTST